jgi:acetyl-CoA carboxylase biotin carboxyl carrier protein
MNIDDVKNLIHQILQSDISEFELEDTGTRLRLKRGLARNSNVISLSTQSTAENPRAANPAGIESSKLPIEASEDREDAGLHIITSPIVGTFYCSPSPKAEPYVKLGDHVKDGSILCLVEAMKLMNEIPSDAEGEIARIYVENNNPVEFGQKLFGIRTGKQG